MTAAPVVVVGSGLCERRPLSARASPPGRGGGSFAGVRVPHTDTHTRPWPSRQGRAGSPRAPPHHRPLKLAAVSPTHGRRDAPAPSPTPPAPPPPARRRCHSRGSLRACAARGRAAAADLTAPPPPPLPPFLTRRPGRAATPTPAPARAPAPARESAKLRMSESGIRVRGVRGGRARTRRAASALRRRSASADWRAGAELVPPRRAAGPGSPRAPRLHSHPHPRRGAGTGRRGFGGRTFSVRSL